jgi:hypothetical protein
VTQIQRSAIFDTRAPVNATSSPHRTRWIRQQGNRISLAGHHRGECRLSSGLHGTSQLLLQDFGQKKRTTISSCSFVPSPDVHRSFWSATRSLASYHVFVLMTQGHDMMVSRGRGMLGRPEGGDAFEHGYLRHLSIVVQGENSLSTYR